jgi:hypothetical protein
MGKPQPQRLEPPPDLSPAEIAVWNRIIETMPAGFFTPSNAFVLRELVAGAASEDIKK